MYESNATFSDKGTPHPTTLGWPTKPWQIELAPPATARSADHRSRKRMELLGDYLLRGKKTADAVEVYRVNAEEFPESERAKQKLEEARVALAEVK